MAVSVVYGARGWLGGQIVAYLETRGETVVRGEARCDDVQAVREELKAASPDVVYVIVGRTHGHDDQGRTVPSIDYLERPGKLRENLRDNLVAPLVVATVANEQSRYVVYMGTGCIFADNPATDPPVTEDAEANFFGSAYSCVKGTTDKLMGQTAIGRNVLNLRLRMPITVGSSPRNLINKLVGFDRVHAVQNSMSVIPTLLPAMYTMVQQRAVGTVNFANPGTITHHEILDMYKELVDPTHAYEGVDMAEHDATLVVAKRSNVHLTTDRILSFHPDLPHVRDAVRQVLVEMAARRGGDKTLVVGLLGEEKKQQPKTLAEPKTILVTGGFGFIGSYVVVELYNTYPGARIVVVDKLTYAANTKNIPQHIQDDHDRFSHHIADIADDETMMKIFHQEAHITHIVHLAAESHVDTSFTSSLVFTRTNVLGTHVLLQCAVTQCPNLVRFLHVSTDEVFGETLATTAVDEDAPTNPTNPYAASKLAAEHMVGSYVISFGLPAVVVRPNNAVGIHQHPEKLVPRFSMLARRGEALTIHGDGTSMRSFLAVADLAEGIVCALDRGQDGEIYNIGVEHELSVQDVVRIVRNAYPPGHVTTICTEDRPFNDKRYFIDSSKIRNLGWSPRTDQVRAINAVVEWYRDGDGHRWWGEERQKQE